MKIVAFILALVFSAIACAQTNSGPTGGGSSGITALTGDCTASGTGSVTINCLTPSHPGYLASRWYLAKTFDSWNTNNGNKLFANSIECAYAAIGKIITIEALGGNVSVVGTSNVQFAVYGNSAGRPGSLLASTGNIVNTSLGAASGALGSNVQIGPGTTAGRDIWFCVNSNDSAVAFDNGYSSSYEGTVSGGTSITVIAQSFGSAVMGVGCQATQCNGGSSTFGTWPSSLAGSTWTDVYPGTFGANMPAFFFEVLSSP